MLAKQILKRNVNFWSITSFIFLLLIIVPSLNILLKIFNSPDEIWFHVKEYLLADYVKNTLIIIFFTGIFSGLIGVTLAWIVSMYEFPFRKMFVWGLLLPLAIPPYIAAYTYSGMLSYTGFIQVFLRNNFNIVVNQKYFNIMNIQGSIAIFTLFLFPYVFIICKSFLQKQSASLIETSRLLGRNQFQTFIYIGLPLLRTALFGSVTLVILETLNDYGVVNYFNIKTFSTAIFTAWFSFGSVDTAIRLSTIAMIIVMVVLILEKLARGKVYGSTTTKVKPLVRMKLKGYKQYLASMYGFIILSISFIIPTLQLLKWSTLSYRRVLNIRFLFLSINTFSIAVVATVIVIIVSLIIANYDRIFKNSLSKIATRITTLGYSIPGAVIAIAVITFFILIDRNLFPLYQLINRSSKTLVLTSSIYMLLFAYVLRFMAIGYNSIESGFEKVGLHYYEASRTLGQNKIKTFIYVDLPMLKPAIISGALLVFIDVIKELPLTLILRPFNYGTLATVAQEYANDEMILEASIPSLLIIAISVIAILLLNRVYKKPRPR